MISVCMATYNGDRFIKNQLKSILEQLSINDEVIVSDDGSDDNTVEVIESFHDNRIRVFRNKFHSPIKNFEFVIGQAHGDVIITSDQDDIWLEGRVKEVIKMHETDDITLVICKAQTINAEGKVMKESFFKDENPVDHSLIHNLKKNPFLGCCLSMKKELIPYILPFPPKIAMHDIWIGLVAQKYFTVSYYGKCPLVQYRRYGRNFTALHHYSFFYKLNYRFYLLKELFKRGFIMKAKYCCPEKFHQNESC